MWFRAYTQRGMADADHKQQGPVRQDEQLPEISGRRLDKSCPCQYDLNTSVERMAQSS
jgi:hypothetical protein